MIEQILMIPQMKAADLSPSYVQHPAHLPHDLSSDEENRSIRPYFSEAMVSAGIAVAVFICILLFSVFPQKEADS